MGNKLLFLGLPGLCDGKSPSGCQNRDGETQDEGDVLPGAHQGSCQNVGIEKLNHFCHHLKIYLSLLFSVVQHLHCPR